MTDSENPEGNLFRGDFQDLANGETPLSGPMTGVKICVIGGGFVGCITAAGFSRFGHSVVCVEKDPEKLAKLQDGKLPFLEQDLEDLIRNSFECKRLSFSSDFEESIEGQQAIFIAVGTPSSTSGRADLKALKDIADTLSRKARPDQVLIIRSTVPVGTAAFLKETLKKNDRPNGQIPVISNPEFLREGTAVYDFFHPHRIVIGGDSPPAIELVARIYRMGMTDHVPIIITNNQTAEMIKYASNAFLATKIGFVNELARLCDRMSVNIMEVARAMGLDSRIGHEFLHPGPGWGGSCLPKDLREFIGLGDSEGVSMPLLQAVGESNKKQHEFVVSKIKELIGTLSDKRIGILGLAFKADTSDTRESPAIMIVNRLIEEGARIRAFDPGIVDDALRHLPDIELVESPYDAVREADCIAILTEWSDFQILDWKKVGELMRSRNIIDARNILAPELLRRYGYNYLSIGQV